MNVVLVFLGGGIGAVLRWLIQLLLGKSDGNGFAWATFTVNCFGSLLIGLLAALALKFKWSEASVLLLMTGVLGGFTTYSAFAMDSLQMLKQQQWALAIQYILSTNIMALLCCALGFYLVKL
ncbi:MAG: fluoride efflux transporter CrcB [Bacteroidota bacterium]|jgi:CrcB protein